MSEMISQKAESSGAAASFVSHGGRRQNLLPCRQCSEVFEKVTVFCPRCHRWNDRSPLALALRVCAVLLFVATVWWTVWAISHADQSPSADASIAPLPTGKPGTDQTDIRF